MLEKQLITKLEETSHIIIYGAGMVGELVYRRLEANGMADRVLCFAVTECLGQKAYLGIPLYGIREVMEYRESATVVVATLPEFHDEMAAVLQELAFRRVVLTDLTLYRSLCKNYIKEFLEKKTEDGEQADVALMASDNNSTSGAFLCMVELAGELKLRGIRPVVILPEYGNGEKVLISNSIDYTYIESENWCIRVMDMNEDRERKLRGNREAVDKLRKYFRKRGIKLVHNNTTYTYAGAVAALEEGLPFVWHLREDIRDQGWEFMDKERSVRLINRSDRIIAISRYMSGILGELDKRKVNVVYDGVDAGKFYCRRLVLEDRMHVTIIMVGAVTEHKRQEELLEAVVILKEKLGTNFQIKFLGKEDGAYVRKLKDAVRRNKLEGVVQFLGRRNNVEDYFCKADIAVVCSRAEPFGRVTVEAQLAGCLVIGADSGATPELVRDGETGLLYRSGDAGHLAERIIEAISFPQKAQGMALTGQEYIRKIFTKENNAEAVMKIYEEILGRGWHEK